MSASADAVLINALSVTIGGGVTYADSLLPRLMKLLPRAVLLTRRAPAGVDAERAIQTTSTWARGVRRFAWEAINLRGILKSHGISTLFTPYQVAIQPRAVVSVCVLHNLEPFFAHQYRYSRRSALRNELLKRMTRSDLDRADLVIAVSDFARHLAVATLRVPEAKLVRIYHGRDDSLVAPEHESDAAARAALGVRGRYVLSAGSLLPYRRTEDVIRAFDEVIAPRDADAVLLIAGTGTDVVYARHLTDVIARAKHPHAIRLLGHVTREHMRALYKGCAAFVSGSEVEACPNIAIEAMTAGCRIIAADAGPSREIYGDAALLYPPRNVARLIELLKSVWDNDPDVRNLAESAVRRSSRFSWDRCAAETCAVLTAACSSA